MNSRLRLLRCLSTQVRAFTPEQAARGWTRGDLRNLRALIRSELFETTTVIARKTPKLEGPLASWAPGKAEPNFNALAYYLLKRWETAATKPTRVILASRKGRRLFGGKEGFKRTQASHDLGVAEIVLWYKALHPEMFDQLRGEDIMRHTRRGQKLPDLFLPDGVAEYASCYSSDRVRAFHQDCEERRLRYALW